MPIPRFASSPLSRQLLGTPIDADEDVSIAAVPAQQPD